MAADDSTQPKSLADDYLMAKERRAAALRCLDAALARLIELHRISAPEPLRGRLLAEADTVRESELMRLAGTDAPVTYGELDTYAPMTGRDAVALLDAYKQKRPDWQKVTWNSLSRTERNRTRQCLRAPGLQRGRPPFRYPDLVRHLATILSEALGRKTLPYSRKYSKDKNCSSEPCGPAFDVLRAALHYAYLSGDPPADETIVALSRNLHEKNAEKNANETNETALNEAILDLICKPRR